MPTLITVSQLNRMAKGLLEQSETMTEVALCGEISNFVRHYKSGHLYFSLRDENSAIKAVMFNRQARLIEFAPEDGVTVLAYGHATIYERDGSFQFYVDFMRPYGIGTTQLAFDRLKEKLEKEGLFAREHKKPLPRVPGCIGVVTSKTGAALQDILHVLQRRWPMVTVLLAPVSVQGLEAEGQIVQGIRALDASGRADVIVVARGGGSREDLWVFNSEKIARAAFACRTPLVSAVGHEIDYSILDYVADLRAPTPSAAAELCVPDRAERLQEIDLLQQNICKNIQYRMNLCYNRFAAMRAEDTLLLFRRSLVQKERDIEALQEQTVHCAHALLAQKSTELAHLSALCQSASPYAALVRGYSILYDEAGALTRVDSLQKGRRYRLRGQRAEAQIEVLAVRETEGEPK